MFFAVERLKNITEELKTYIHTGKTPLETFKVKSCGYGSYELLNEDDSSWENYLPGKDWGGKDAHYWFRTTFEIPKEFEGKTAVLELETGRSGWDALNPQFLVYLDGKAVQGVDVNHKEILLDTSANAGKSYRLDLYAYSGMNEGYTTLRTNLLILEKEVESLYYNLLVPLQVAELLDTEDKRRIDILNYLTLAINKIDLRLPQNADFYASVKEVNRYLEEEFYGKFCGKGDITEICVGHTHIDVAWLWTLAQTREKSARSFSTVLNLMKQYPDYVFMSSQPQLYQYVKQDHPDIYEGIKEMIKAGRWEAEGAMWLEADCNLTSGESLVRQILFGTRFFRQEFGVENKILWLPDVFGYSAALPQILKKSGIDYFMTTKISWNEFNKLPYDTFMWKGLDGTEILTYFISTQNYSKNGQSNTGTTYNGDTTPTQVMGCWQRYQQKEISSAVLNCFGYGDGGGGPTKQMLEYEKRLEKGIPGCPTTKQGKALDFFKNLDENVSGNKRLPRWVGELYLEFHRGTYTSNARNKRYNRKTEILNEEAELFSSMNAALAQGGYPQKEINACWETTLLNQFHDIIPGSSIKEVYEDSKAQYEQIGAVGKELVASALTGVVRQISVTETSVIVFNQLGYDRSDIVTAALPEGWNFATVYDNGKALDTQPAGKDSILFFAENVPSKGYKAFTLRQQQPQAAAAATVDAGHLENRFYSIDLDQNGSFTSVYDKQHHRQVLQDGQKGNLLQAFEDKPIEYDAWNIDIFYQEKMWEVTGLESAEIIENGPVRTTLKTRRRFLNSTIEQKIMLYGSIARIDFDTSIDWHEKQILLKAAFPVDVHTDKATYEIQYGNVERPTHWNTSWDWARFEVCAHRWADLSEGGYGVSLLNDCKYGHDIRDSVMRLTLLKSPISPNVDADREQHHFVYSLYPHAQDWKTAGTAPMACNLNSPLYAVPAQAHGGALPSELSFVSADADNVMIEVVKKAEDSDDFIIRLYEYKNTRARVKLTFARPLIKAAECDLMENETSGIVCDGNGFAFEIKPFEIMTFKVSL